MKKLLCALGAITIVGSSAASVVACNGKGDSNSGNNDLDNEQKAMLDGAGYITKMILAGRHENLNYNVNELLTAALTPTKVQEKIPDVYTYDNKQFTPGASLNNYLNYLAPSLQYFNGTSGDFGVYGSYVMGMYDDGYYQNFINSVNQAASKSKMSFNDSIGLGGGTSGPNGNDFNVAEHTQGLMMGLLKQTPLLSKNEERRNLAWGVQDTGALTNFLLSKGYDGLSPFVGPTPSAFDASSMSFSKRTNYAGYLFYNSATPVAASTSYIKTGNDFIKNLQAAKLANSDYNFAKVNKLNSRKTGGQVTNKDGSSTINFGSTGADLLSYTADLNVTGTSTSFINYFNALSNTHSGALILSRLLNSMYPIIPAWGSDVDIQAAASCLLINPLKALFSTSGVIQEVQDALKSTIDLSLNDNEIATTKITDNVDSFSGIMGSQKTQPVLSNLFTMTKAVDDNASADIKANAYRPAVDNAVSILDKIISNYSSASTDAKKAFADTFFKFKDGLFYKEFSFVWNNSLGSDLRESEWNELVNMADNGSSGINLLALLRDSLKDLSTSAKTVFEIYDNPKYANLANNFSGKAFQDFSSGEMEEYIKLLGFNGTNFNSGSILDLALQRLNVKQKGYSELMKFLTVMTNKASEKMKEPHEKYFQYLYDDKYWKTSDVKISTNESGSIGATMEFTLNYTGLGDKTSTADQQTKKVEVSREFNPYQTIKQNQLAIFDEAKKEVDSNPQLDYKNAISSADAEKLLDDNKISGTVLGKSQLNLSDQDLISYDGLGLKEDLAPVNHKYKIKWANVSNDASSPYWVIVGISSFNEKGEEFYNIY